MKKILPPNIAVGKHSNTYDDKTIISPEISKTPKQSVPLADERDPVGIVQREVETRFASSQSSGYRRKRKTDRSDRFLVQRKLAVSSTTVLTETTLITGANSAEVSGQRSKRDDKRPKIAVEFPMFGIAKSAPVPPVIPERPRLKRSNIYGDKLIIPPRSVILILPMIQECRSPRITHSPLFFQVPF
ncbi:hypothetical protein AB6A40_002726 [Gnathostoma spinigerum]|uniref:Uncharacterized protein n=1 Tax=Gnathostoma spinigerum TaxID=75299 RepID=A0ABD6E9N5_9BILA